MPAAVVRPATLPNVVLLASEFPLPAYVGPSTPPVHSPAAYSPGIGCDETSARYYVRLVYDMLNGQRDLILALHAATQFEEGFSVGAPVDAILRGSPLGRGVRRLAVPARSQAPTDELIEQLAVYIVAALSNRDKLT